MDVSSNTNQIIDLLKAKSSKIDASVKDATNQIKLDTVGVMMQQIVGGHPYGTDRSQGGNIIAGKPSNVTGNLRNSIPSSSRTEQEGFGVYKAIVGAGMIYARALELGHPNWRSGIKYPFVEPTATIMKSNNRLQNVYIKAIQKALAK